MSILSSGCTSKRITVALFGCSEGILHALILVLLLDLLLLGLGWVLVGGISLILDLGIVVFVHLETLFYYNCKYYD